MTAKTTLADGDVVIAAITSCTNTSNPSVLIGSRPRGPQGARAGLTVKPWVKTSLAPGSQVVTEYLEKAGLQEDLDAMGFNLVGYGCTTCIGNSGPLPTEISEAIHTNDLNVCAVLSGNRNFEGRISPDIKSNYLASPPLVVAYALSGSMLNDIYEDPIGQDRDGNDVFLKDVWPTNKEINDLIESSLSREMFESRYGNVFAGDEMWQNIPVTTGQTYQVERRFDLCPPAPASLRICRPSPSRRRISQALGCLLCWRTASQPITFHRPVRSRKTARQVTT
jgi:aconitate hydratase